MRPFIGIIVLVEITTGAFLGEGFARPRTRPRTRPKTTPVPARRDSDAQSAPTWPFMFGSGFLGPHLWMTRDSEKQEGATDEGRKVSSAGPLGNQGSRNDQNAKTDSSAIPSARRKLQAPVFRRDEVPSAGLLGNRASRNDQNAKTDTAGTANEERKGSSTRPLGNRASTNDQNAKADSSASPPVSPTVDDLERDFSGLTASASALYGMLIEHQYDVGILKRDSEGRETSLRSYPRYRELKEAIREILYTVCGPSGDELGDMLWRWFKKGVHELHERWHMRRFFGETRAAEILASINALPKEGGGDAEPREDARLDDSEKVRRLQATIIEHALPLYSPVIEEHRVRRQKLRSKLEELDGVIYNVCDPLTSAFGEEMWLRYKDGTLSPQRVLSEMGRVRGNQPAGRPPLDDGPFPRSWGEPLLDDVLAAKRHSERELFDKHRFHAREVERILSGHSDWFKQHEVRYQEFVYHKTKRDAQVVALCWHLRLTDCFRYGSGELDPAFFTTERSRTPSELIEPPLHRWGTEPMDEYQMVRHHLGISERLKSVAESVIKPSERDRRIAFHKQKIDEVIFSTVCDPSRCATAHREWEAYLEDKRERAESFPYYVDDWVFFASHQARRTRSLSKPRGDLFKWTDYTGR